MDNIDLNDSDDMSLHSLKKEMPKYDVWLHWSITNLCNLQCSYCFSSPAEGMPDPRKRGKISLINIPSLLRTLEKTNRIFRINFTGGGEPFLVPNLIEACSEITKEHYISFNTNLTGNIEKLLSAVNPQKIVNIHASLHLKELERKNLTKKFIENYLLCKDAGININAHEIAVPSIIHEIDKYKEIFHARGIGINFSPFIGSYNSRSFPVSYTDDELYLFGFGRQNIDLYSTQKGKPCNAGYNLAFVYQHGYVRACGPLYEILGNIYRRITFKKKMVICPSKNCPCPIKEFDTYLYKKALMEAGETFRKSSPLVNNIRKAKYRIIMKSRNILGKRNL